MNSSELYKKAYHLHYTDNDYEGALEIYKQLQALHPDSKESSWAESQMENARKALSRSPKSAIVVEQSVEEMGNHVTEKDQKNLAIKLILSKSQSKGIMGKVNFKVYAKVNTSKYAEELIRDYHLYKEVLFKKKMVSIWGYPTNCEIEVRVEDLLAGQSYSCKNLDEVIGYSESVKEACKVFMSYLKIASEFGGEEIIEMTL